MIRNFKKASITLSVILILFSVFLTGCNIIEKLFINDLMPKRVVNKNKSNQQTNLSKSSNLSKEVKIIENSNVIEKDKNNENEKKNNEKNTEKYKVILFFAKKDATGFIQEERTINKVSSLAKETILELIKGPSNIKKTAPTIPKETKLKDIVIRDGVCYVDFSKELQKNHLGGSAGETMTVHSIVKTLSQYSSISKVQILIDGKITSTLAGHIDTSKPLENTYK